MTSAPRSLGTRVRFLRTDDRTQPAESDPAWIDFGAILDGSVELEREAKEVWGPFTGGGRIELHDVIDTKRGLVRGFIAQELSPLALEVLFGSDALDELSEDYYALAGDTKKGWVLVTRYDQDDALIATEYAYVHLAVSGPVRINADLAIVPCEATQLIPGTRTGASWWNPEEGAQWWNPEEGAQWWNPEA